MRIAVALATHQGAAFLERQLASIAGQTRLPDVLHAVDDGSTDATPALLARFAARSPFPVHIAATDGRGAVGPVGPTLAFAQAIASVGDDVDLVVLADQDDVWLPHKLARMEAALAARPDALMAFSDAFLIDAAGTRARGTGWDLPGFHRRRRQQVRADALGVLANHYVVSGCLMAFRADLRALLLPFPAELRFDPDGMQVLHDTWITLVAAAVGAVAVIDEPLVEYRRHPDQVVGTTRSSIVRAALPAELRWRLVGRRPRRDLVHRRGLATLLRIVEQRVDERMAGPGRDTALADVRAAATHLEVRAAVDGPRRQRIAPILREVRGGGYGRFSSGIPSATADLLRRPLPPHRPGP